MPNLDFKKRPLSWSQISQFRFSNEQWYRSYILGEKQTSRELDFGSKIDKLLQDDSTFLPEVPRYPLMQYKMNVMFGDVHLVGIPDGLSFDPCLLADFKTGKKPWTQKRADETGQLTMYLLLLYISKKIKPEEFRCFIHWLPTTDKGDFTVDFVDNMKPITFETKRTMRDILMFGAEINNTIKEMNEYLNVKLSPDPQLTPTASII